MLNKQDKQEPPEGVLFSAYSGPIPPAEELGEYNKVLPGAAKTIMDTFVAQSKHRRRMEKKSINAQVFLDFAGMVLAWGITLAVIVVAYYLLKGGHTIEGLGALAVSLLERWWATYKKPPKDPK